MPVVAAAAVVALWCALGSAAPWCCLVRALCRCSPLCLPAMCLPLRELLSCSQRPASRTTASRTTAQLEQTTNLPTRHLTPPIAPRTQQLAPLDAAMLRLGSQRACGAGGDRRRWAPPAAGPQRAHREQYAARLQRSRQAAAQCRSLAGHASPSIGGLPIERLTIAPGAEADADAQAAPYAPPPVETWGQDALLMSGWAAGPAAPNSFACRPLAIGLLHPWARPGPTPNASPRPLAASSSPAPGASPAASCASRCC